jgi:hypothetical protein
MFCNTPKYLYFYAPVKLKTRIKMMTSECFAWVVYKIPFKPQGALS